MDDFTNPDKELICQGSRKVDFSSIDKICIRKLIITFINTSLVFANLRSDGVYGDPRQWRQRWGQRRLE